MRLIFSLLILLLFINGCIKNSKDNEDLKEEIRTNYSQHIPVIDEAWLQDKIKNRNGKILFVNVWATWCEPCVAEFPDLVKINNKHKNSGFEFLSISVDMVSEIETKIKPFLSEQSADFNVVVANEKRSEQIINVLNPGWNGAIPVTIIFDENGKRREFISEARDFDFFNERIRKVME